MQALGLVPLGALLGPINRGSWGDDMGVGPGALFETSWGEGLKISYQKVAVVCDLQSAWMRLGRRSCGRPGAVSGPSWAPLEPLLGPPGGALLGPLGALLGSPKASELHKKWHTIQLRSIDPADVMDQCFLAVLYSLSRVVI